MSLDTATEAALKRATEDIARAVVLPRYRSLDAGQIDTKTSADDLVTIADKESEARLAETVETLLPGAAYVGEEGVAADPDRLNLIGTSDLCVIVDPIDGTWNFANGVNSFGIIIAVASHGQTIWGGIYDPLCNDWMTARPGQGTRFTAADGSGRSVTVGDACDDIKDAFGLVDPDQYSEPMRSQMTAHITAFRRIGSLRCSAHEYRLLSSGFADFKMSSSMNPWDHAAGALMMAEAGGAVRMLDGADYAPTIQTGRLLVAKTEHLWTKIADRLHFFAV